MKKRILLVITTTFIMLILLSGGAALAVTFGFDTQESLPYDNAITDSYSGHTLQISSSEGSDIVTNYSMDTTLAGAVNYSVASTEGFVVCVTSAEGNNKPIGTVTVRLASGGIFSLNGFYCGNGGGDDNLILTTGSTTETFPVLGAREAYIDPSTAFQGITSFSIDWEEKLVAGITNPHCMFFDKFDITINQAPTGISLNSTNVLEHCEVGTEVGSLSGTDPDTGSTFTYALVSGEGDTDNSCFTIAGSKLLLNTVPDFEAKSEYKIRLRVTDEGSLSYEKGFTITVLDGNDPPTDISIAGGSIAENAAPGSSTGTLATVDNAGDTFTYSFVAGTGATDNSGFSLSGNVLTINSSADYEAKNSYSVRIRSMDNHGLYYEKALTITVTNVNEAPTDMALTNNTIAENSAIGTTIGTLSGTDPDAGTTLTFSLTAGYGDNACFTISGSSLKLAVKPDFETKDSYSILIRESDGAFTFDKVFTIHITDANDAPTDIILSSSSLLEHAAVGTAIGTLTSSDPDGGTFTYSLVAGDGSTDNASFSISGSTLEAAFSYDFEVKSSYGIRIRTTDSTGLYYEKVFIINIINGYDPPTDISLTNQSIAENSPSGTIIGTLSSTDINGPGPFTYYFTSGTGDTDNPLFTIEGSTLKIVSAPNYEVKNSYSIRIRTTNEVTHFYYDKTFTISITNVNEAPMNITLSGTSITEHAGTTVAIISGTDPDTGSTFTYELAAGVGDTDNTRFTIAGNELKLNEEANYEVKPTYNIHVRVTDNGSLTFEKQFAITVIDGNDPPNDLYLTSSSIQENKPSGVTLTSFGYTDINGGLMHFSLVDGAGSADNDKFILSDNQLSMSVVPDHETKNSYSIRARVTDSGGLYYEKAFTITVEDMPETPTNIVLSNSIVLESSPSGTAIGTLSGTDQDAGDTFTYSMVSGAGSIDNSSFAVVGNTLRTVSSFNHEVKDSYSIRIRVTDSTGLWYDKQFAMSVGDVNEAPTGISLSSTSVAENSAIGTTIGTLSGTDPDAEASFTYSLAAGVGDTDNSCFTISGGALKLAVVPDFETKDSYAIRIRVSDGSLTFDKQFTITVTDGNDAPTDIALSSNSVAENTASGTNVANISTTDPNGGSFTYALAAGTGSSDNASFAISGNALLLAFIPDYETKASYNIRIRTTDDGGMYYEEAFIITITDVNEAPKDIVLSNNKVSENKPSGTAIGTLSGTDPDTGSTFTYSLVSGTGDADNASFVITGSTLQTASVFDCEAKNSYSVRIRVADAGGLGYEKQFAISVVPESIPVTGITVTGTGGAISVQAGGTLQMLAAVSPVDATDNSVTWSVTSGCGATISTGGLLTATTAGSVSVRAAANDSSGVYGERIITITAAPTAFVAVTNISGVPTTATVGIPLTLTGTVAPANATNKTIVWSVQNAGTTGAKVSGSILSTTGAGTVFVRATIVNGLTENSPYTQDFNISVSMAPVTIVAVTNITGVPTTAVAGTPLTLSGTVAPADATNRTIVWSVQNAGTTGATVSGSILSTTGAGTVFVRATITNGLTESTPYTQDFTITVSAAPIADNRDSDNNQTTQATQTAQGTPTYNAELESGASSNSSLPVTVDKGNGIARVEIGSGSGLMSGGKPAVITVPSIPDINTYTLDISVPDLSTPGGKGALSFHTDAGSVTVPSNMLTGNLGISGVKAEIAIGRGDKTKLPEDVKAAIGNKPLVQLTLSIDGKQRSWNNPDAPVTVSVPYTPTAAERANPESIVIWYIDGSGKVVSIPNGHYDPATGSVTFSTTHFSSYAVVYHPVVFSDVAANVWYNRAVSFIAARDITSGTGNGKYSPEAKLTRGEFIVLIMRAYGIAPDKNPTDNFSDAGSTYYTGYLSAAKRLGISAGVGNNSYAPGNEITRQEMFTLLFHELKVINQLPQGDSGKRLSDFTDAGQIDEWARKATEIFVVTGTAGGNAGKLAPTDTTTRAEMAQVLYNLLGK